MKLLFLTDSLSDLDGVGRYGLELIRSMQRLRPDIRVHVLLARKHRPTSVDVPPDWRVEVALPPDYFYYMTPTRYWVSRIAATWRTWRAARGADLVHAIKDYPHNHVALDAARLAGRPCVATIHGTYTIQPLLTARHAARARRAYRRFGRMVAVSRYTRGRLLALMGPAELDPDKVVVVPNCVDAERYAAPRDVGVKPWHAGPFSLAIGEVKERKGHHLSLAAFLGAARNRPEWRHYIVGKLSGDAYENALRAAVREAGMEERVIFLGNIGEDEKIDLLRRAEVFVHTPVTAADGGFEGFGIVYLEAGAAGTAVVGTRDCGAEDAIVDGRTGFLVDQDVAAVQRALETLFDDADLRARLAREGAEHARSMRWDDNAARVLALYDGLLTAKPLRRPAHGGAR